MYLYIYFQRRESNPNLRKDKVCYVEKIPSRDYHNNREYGGGSYFFTSIADFMLFVMSGRVYESWNYSILKKAIRIIYDETKSDDRYAWSKGPYRQGWGLLKEKKVRKAIITNFKFGDRVEAKVRNKIYYGVVVNLNFKTIGVRLDKTRKVSNVSEKSIVRLVKAA